LARIADPALAERRRAEILDAAIACFREHGFHQASMQRICAAAGLSAGAVYRYFSSKSDIIAAIAEQDRTALAAALTGAMSSGQLVQDVAAVARGMIERMCGEGGLVAEVLAEAARDPELRARLAVIDAEAQRALADAIVEAQARGDADAALDATEAAMMLFAALDGIGLRTAMFGGGDLTEALRGFQRLAVRYFAPQHDVAPQPAPEGV
jgi:AcrR family transcriptional regulator